MGARHVVVTDVNDYRLELARKMGATRAVNVKPETLDQTMKELGMKEGFDVGLEMSGNAAAFREMLDDEPRRQRSRCWGFRRRKPPSTGTR